MVRLSQPRLAAFEGLESWDGAVIEVVVPSSGGSKGPYPTNRDLWLWVGAWWDEDCGDWARAGTLPR